MVFEIISRRTDDDAPSASRSWEVLPEDNSFETETEAWDAIEDLRKLGPEWEIAEYDVKERR